MITRYPYRVLEARWKTMAAPTTNIKDPVHYRKTQIEKK
jgi:hypothetical protein